MSQWVIQVSAGTGPAEVRAFAARLAEHITALCAERGLGVIDTAWIGSDEAPRSVEITVEGPAPVQMADYVGTHALISRSPERGRRSRKRWFVGVSVHAARGAPADVLAIDPAEVEMRADRAGGPGGQHVNRTASAVRAVHRPTGIAVRVTDERSQHQNRRRALMRLSALLAARADAHAAKQEQGKRHSHYEFTRGAAVRTWQLDHRGRSLIPCS